MATKAEQKLAVDMLKALLNVLEEHDIPGKYYTEFLGNFCDQQAVDILRQEREVA